MEKPDQYIVSARKYRPSTFGSVVGQKALTQTLKNAVSSGRLAQAYLFCGPRGVGKTSCARIFAKRINCQNPTADGESCGECPSCKAIESGFSFNIIELDAASNNSVDDIRELTEQVKIPPQEGKYRVFIIDEVHMLSSQAFNAFLKTLEEPPSYVVFILATTEKHKVIPTILSRCQIYDFKRITIDDMTRHLAYVASQEGIEAEQEALAIIAQKADGAMRDALSIFDQVAASSGGHVTYERTIASLNVLDYGYYFRLTECFRHGNVPEALLIYKEVRDAGFDSYFFLNGLASHVRDLMVASDASTVPLLEVGEEIGKKYVELAQSMPLQWYYNAMRILNDADVEYRTSGNKQLLVELALIRLCGQATLQNVQQTQSPAQSAQSSSQPQPQTPRPAQASAQSAAPAQPAQTKLSPHPVAGYRPAVRPSATPRAPRVGGSPSTFRLTRATQPDAEEAGDKKEPPSDRPQHRNKKIEKDSFFQAWHQFGEDHSEYKLLITAMRVGEVRALSATQFGIVVASQAQAQAFENDIPHLTQYLRDKLENDDITVVTVQGATVERKRKLMPAEMVKKVVEENHLIGELLKDIDAELR